MTKCGILHRPIARRRPPAPQALLHREAYPERPESVRHIETHISHVFLTDRFAYNIKKPVQFEFLDFSTLEQRRWMSAEEVRLNRRLAPDAYLDVVPIVRDSSGNVRVEQKGTPIERAIKMRRLTDPYGDEKYSPSLRQRVYDEMFERAERLLSDGISVILDGTFLKRNLREAALRVAEQHNARFLIVNCLCPDDLIYDRIRSRNQDETRSEARPDLLGAQRDDEEPFDEQVRHVNIDTMRVISHSIDRVIEAM